MVAVRPGRFAGRAELRDFGRSLPVVQLVDVMAAGADGEVAIRVHPSVPAREVEVQFPVPLVRVMPGTCGGRRVQALS